MKDANERWEINMINSERKDSRDKTRWSFESIKLHGANEIDSTKH